MAIETAIAYLLRTHAGLFFCAACLALKASAGLQETQEALTGLHRFADFRFAQAKCSECLRAAMVAAAVDDRRPGADDLKQTT